MQDRADVGVWLAGIAAAAQAGEVFQNTCFDQCCVCGFQEEENAPAARQGGAATKSASKRAKKARQKQKSAAADSVAAAPAEASSELHTKELSGAATFPLSKEPASSVNVPATAQQQSTAAARQAASTGNVVQLPYAGAESTGAQDVDAGVDAAWQPAATLPAWMVCSLTGVRAFDTLGLSLMGRNFPAALLTVALEAV